MKITIKEIPVIAHTIPTGFAVTLQNFEIFLLSVNINKADKIKSPIGMIAKAIKANK